MTAETFYVVKGIVGAISVIGLIIHMNMIWPSLTTMGRRLRYITLFYFAVLITSASVEQLKDGVEVSLRNIGALGGVILLVITAVVSIREEGRGKA